MAYDIGETVRITCYPSRILRVRKRIRAYCVMAGLELSAIIEEEGVSAGKKLLLAGRAASSCYAPRPDTSSR